MCSSKLNIETNILLRFGLLEGCFFLRCVQETEGYRGQGRWPVGPVKVSAEAPVRLASDWRASWDDWSSAEGRGLVKGHTGCVWHRHNWPCSGSEQVRTSSWLNGRRYLCCTSASFWWVLSSPWTVRVITHSCWNLSFCPHVWLSHSSSGSHDMFVTIFLSCSQAVNCWHDLDNTEYDCWPINSPNDYNMISCGGEFPL